MYKRFIEAGATLLLLLSLSFVSLQSQDTSAPTFPSIDSIVGDSDHVSVQENDTSIQSGQQNPEDDSEADSEIDSETDSEMDSEMNSETDSENDSEMNSEMNSETDSETDSENDSKNDADSNTNGNTSGDDSSPSSEIISQPIEGTRYVTAYSLNVRSYPSTDAKIIGTLYINNEVTLISKNQTNFYEVKCGDLVGYVHKNYLSETKVVIQPVTKPEISVKPNPDSTGSGDTTTTDLQQLIAHIATNNLGTMPCTAGYCARWVSGVYQAAGLGYPGGNAIDYWTRWGSTGSTSMDNIPIGAVVVGSGSGSALGNEYGHVGIYIGNGMVADNPGYHRIISIEDWAKRQVGTCHGYHGYIGWVWPYGQPL